MAKDRNHSWYSENISWWAIVGVLGSEKVNYTLRLNNYYCTYRNCQKIIFHCFLNLKDPRCTTFFSFLFDED